MKAECVNLPVDISVQINPGNQKNNPNRGTLKKKILKEILLDFKLNSIDKTFLTIRCIALRVCGSGCRCGCDQVSLILRVHICKIYTHAHIELYYHQFLSAFKQFKINGRSEKYNRRHFPFILLSICYDSIIADDTTTFL